MATVKLTLSADEALVDEAKKLARERRTSVSAMFARFVLATRQAPGQGLTALGPLTQQATGLVRLPEGQSNRDLLADALTAKYRGRT